MSLANIIARLTHRAHGFTAAGMGIALGLGMGLVVTGSTMVRADDRPNIVILMADDLGYSDTSAYGSEIPTPNIDALVASGQMYTDFHTQASCSPTRASLLTGADNHRTGFGNVSAFLRFNPGQIGQPGYETLLNDRVVTVATLLRDAGYHTYLSGKWQLGIEGGEEGNYWPDDRGFEKSFGIITGAASHFDDRIGFSRGRPIAIYAEDGVEIPAADPLPADFDYSTFFYTQRMKEYIESNREDGQPFFAYLAYTAPHAPLHVPDGDTYVDEILADTATYDYQSGWDDVRSRRFDRLKTLGLVPTSAALPPRQSTENSTELPIPEWDDLTSDEQQYEAKRMAVYAAMIRHLDDSIGSFVQYLDDTGELDNTIIVFFSDNGPEDLNWGDLRQWKRWFGEMGTDNSLANLGKRNSWIAPTTSWAQVSATPYFSAKGNTGEGGIRNAFAVTGPGIEPGTRTDALATVMDLAPSFLKLAGVSHPGVKEPTGAGEVFAMDGRSLVPLWHGKKAAIRKNRDTVGFEWTSFGLVRKALVAGDGTKILKLGDVPYGDDPSSPRSQPWRLFDLDADPTEMTDRAAQDPGRLRDMIAEYNKFERHVGYVWGDALTADAPSGTDASYSLEISNDTVTSDTFELKCHSEWDCELGDREIALAAGGSAMVSLTVSVPAGAQEGDGNSAQVEVDAVANPSASTTFSVVTTVVSAP